jgi:uncharacterized protein (DUF4415 family)
MARNEQSIDLGGEGKPSRTARLRRVTMRKEYDFSKGKRGAVVAPDPGKVRITIRLDADVIDWFRDQVTAAGGGNY